MKNLTIPDNYSVKEVHLGIKGWNKIVGMYCFVFAFFMFASMFLDKYMPWGEDITRSEVL